MALKCDMYRILLMFSAMMVMPLSCIRPRPVCVGRFPVLMKVRYGQFINMFMSHFSQFIGKLFSNPKAQKPKTVPL